MNLPARKCRVCSGAIPRSNRKGRTPLYCSDACRKRNAVAREAERRERIKIDFAKHGFVLCSKCGVATADASPGKTTCRPCHNEYHRVTPSAATSRARYLAKRGFTPEQWHAVYTAQNGRCAVCPDEPDRRKRRLTLHADPDTGELRGLLCPPCAATIRDLESPGYLERLVTYFEKPAPDA